MTSVMKHDEQMIIVTIMMIITHPMVISIISALPLMIPALLPINMLI
jgi:hypothetical protein